MEQEGKRETWRISKEIPFAVIFTMFGAIASGIWYASQADQRLSTVEQAVKTTAEIRDEISSIKGKLDTLDRVVIRLENYLDRRAAVPPKTDRMGALSERD